MNNREIALYVALGGAVGWFLFSRTEAGQQVNVGIAETVGDTVNKVTSAVRGIRNNNPGNIRKSPEAWQGLSPTQTDSAFFQFQSMPYGVRAMVKILRNYSTKYGLDNVQGIINRWAPANENDTGAYVAAVARALEVSPTQTLNLDNADTMFTLVRAIISHENGRIPGMLVADSAIWQGIQLA